MNQFFILKINVIVAHVCEAGMQTNSIGWAESSPSVRVKVLSPTVSVSSLVRWGQFRAQVNGQNTSSKANGRGEARQLLVEGEEQGVMMKWPLLNAINAPACRLLYHLLHEQSCYLSQIDLLCFCCQRVSCLSLNLEFI